jgi:glucose/arabinose dehydrogenase
MLRCSLLAGLAIALGASLAHAQGAAVRIASGLPSPIYVAGPDGDARVFIVLRGGVIRIHANGALLPDPFLDISDRVVVPPESEAGLLSLAFSADYATTGVFYVFYQGDIDPGAGVTLESRVARFTATGDPATSNDADEGSEQILYRLEQFAGNHKGGTIAIRGGFLYLGLGDGGGDGEVAQSDASDFGKFLRFDVAQQQVPWSYTHWSKGFRNPFRWSFDRDTGDLYIGDVGQSAREEISVEPADAGPGLNYGWDVMEGTSCFDPDPGEPPCFDASLVPPVYDYANDDTTCAVTGGSVYRGSQSPSLRGVYFFSDACSGRLMSLRWNPATGDAEDVLDRTDEFPPDAGVLGSVVAIAQDGVGELYAVNLFGGAVFRLVPEPGATLAGVAALVTVAACRRRSGTFFER